MSFDVSTTPASYSDAIAQIARIQDQIASVRTAFSGAEATSGGAAVSGSTTTASGAASSSSFASQLQSALADSDVDGSDSALTGSDLTASSLLGSGLNSSQLTGLTPTTSLTGLTGTATGGAALPTNASSMLTSDQQQFASQLASDTGLDPGVVSAWLLAEESGSAATARQDQDNNDWLNIGYTGSGTYGSSDSVWSSPTTAASATAGWLKGQDTIPGYGTASSGIQSIVATAGQAPATQIQALQGSGWSSSGYPDLDSLYSQVAG